MGRRVTGGDQGLVGHVKRGWPAVIASGAPEVNGTARPVIGLIGRPVLSSAHWSRGGTGTAPLDLRAFCSLRFSASACSAAASRAAAMA